MKDDRGELDLSKQIEDKDEDGITFGDRTMIPRQWVKKIQKLQ